MMRSAITSEPLTGEAVEMRLPLMSESLLMPLGQRHLHLAVADHVHVGDRARGGLGGDGPARHLLAEQVGHRATQRIVDASCRSGRDRELGLRLGRARPGSCQAQRTRRAAGGDEMASINQSFLH
jgi:hypothetical protein